VCTTPRARRCSSFVDLESGAIVPLPAKCCYRTQKSLKRDNENCDGSRDHAGRYGFLRTRLLQVLVKDGGEWKIAANHNWT
jgi:hypothetical protein